jgi:hypothetical protein
VPVYLAPRGASPFAALAAVNNQAAVPAILQMMCRLRA